MFLLLLLLLVGCKSRNQDEVFTIPSVYVNVSSADLDSMMRNKHYKASAFVSIVSSKGDTLLSDSVDNIHTRGNTTFGHNKKAFTVKLRKKKKLLDLDTGKRFVLLANAYDESHIRNAIAFDLAQRMGLKSPKYSYVSLYINSEYRGLYQMTNKVEDLMDFKNNGFLIEGNSNVELPRHLTTERKETIISSYNLIISNIEKCFDCDSCYDSLQRWMDLVSFAKYYILQEISLNMDAPGPGSFFKYASDEDGGKLHAGPVWDFDKFFATIHRGWNYEWEKNEIMACAGVIDSSGHVYSGLLLHCLWKREEFRNLVKDLYNNEISTICHTYIESGRIDSLVYYLRPEAKRDYRTNVGWRWFAYEEETQRVRAFLKQRIEFLDWFFNSPKENMVCITYLDSCFRGSGGGDKIAQVWIPSKKIIKVPKLLAISFNYTPIPDALYYKGTNIVVSNKSIINSEDEFELKWRKPSPQEVLLRRIRKKLHYWGL